MTSETEETVLDLEVWRDIASAPDDFDETYFLVRPRGLHPARGVPYAPTVACRMGDELFSADNHIDPLRWTKGDGDIRNGPTTSIREANLEWAHVPGAALSRAPEDQELGSSTRMTSPASRSQTPLSAGEVDLPNYWRAVVGDIYKPAVLRNVKHMHPTTVKEVFDRHAGTDVADVIAGLIFTNQIANNRSEFFAEEYAKARADLAALSPPSTGGEGEEFLEFKEALSDIRALRAEYECLNGGGPGWVTRNQAAWARVDELFANDDEAAYDRQQEDAHG